MEFFHDHVAQDLDAAIADFFNAEPEILSNVVYGVVAHPLGLLSGSLGFGRFQAVDKTGALDDFGQLFGPV
jgi:hypothetical protein